MGVRSQTGEQVKPLFRLVLFRFRRYFQPSHLC
jgi:hypothetical protein